MKHKHFKVDIKLCTKYSTMQVKCVMAVNMLYYNQITIFTIHS